MNPNTSVRDQNDTFIANEPFAYYSYISTPSFTGFKDIEDPSKFVLDPYVREIMLSNLQKLDVKLALRYYYLINACHTSEEFDLIPSANFFARELLSLAVVSMGSEQGFLKTLLTNYSITEQKVEQKAYEEIRQEQLEKEKKQWKFFGKKSDDK